MPVVIRFPVYFNEIIVSENWKLWNCLASKYINCQIHSNSTLFCFVLFCFSISTILCLLITIAIDDTKLCLVQHCINWGYMGVERFFVTVFFFFLTGDSLQWTSSIKKIWVFTLAQIHTFATVGKYSTMSATRQPIIIVIISFLFFLFFFCLFVWGFFCFGFFFSLSL